MNNSFRHKMDLSIRFMVSRKELDIAAYLKEQLSVLDDILLGKPYLAVTFYVPGELLALFDVTALYMERIAGFGAANRICTSLETYRGMTGFPYYGCSYQLLFDYMINSGILPKPYGFVAASFACDDAWSYCRYASGKYGIPFYFMDVLNGCDVNSSEYLAAQLKELYTELQSVFPQVLSVEEVVDASNKGISSKSRIDELRFKYPGIMNSTQAFKMFTIYNDLGRKEAVSVLNQTLEDLQQKAVTYAYNNEPRVLWLGILPLYKNSIIQEIEKKYKCRIVYEELYSFPHEQLSVKSFFNDLAKRIEKNLFYTPEKRMEAIISLIDKLEIDGIIHFSQNNCRFLPPQVPLLQRKLSELGIPFVEVRGDAVEPECFNENQFFNYLDTFFEIICRGVK